MSKNVLVTGSAGFIAGHLIEHLLKNTDFTIYGLDRLDTTSDLRRVDEVINVHPEWRDRYKFYLYDLQHKISDGLARELGEINYIFHLAASSHVDDSIKQPLIYAYDNVIGGVNLLEYCRTLSSLEYVQIFSTDEIYGTAPPGISFDEQAEIKARNPYAAFKASTDVIAYSYYNTYSLPIVISNTVNVIGEKQDSRKFLPLLIKKIINDESVCIHCYPGNKLSGSRNYVHARNVASACLFLLGNAEFGEKYNIGGQIELTNLELAQMVAKITDKELQYYLDSSPSSRPGHDHRYCLDWTKLQKMGFKYPVEFLPSLEKTIKWYIRPENSRWLQSPTEVGN